MKAFIDSTGAQWSSGALNGKPAGVFVSTGAGAGKETTVLSMISTIVHHGMLFFPLVYVAAYKELSDLTVVHGGSGWGA